MRIFEEKVVDCSFKRNQYFKITRDLSLMRSYIYMKTFGFVKIALS